MARLARWPTMRALLALALLLAPALAGCVGSSTTQPLPAPPSAPSAGLPALGSSAPFTMLLCAGDKLEALASAHKDCNVQVTKKGPAAEVDLVASPLDERVLVAGAKDFSLGDQPPCWVHNVWTGVYASRDAGRTWSTGLIPGYPGDAANKSLPLAQYPCASDPALAFDGNGTLYYASLAYEPCPASQQPPTPLLEPVSACSVKSAMVVTRSRDAGQTWDLQTTVAERFGGAILDKEWLAADPATGQVYMTYIDTGTGAIEVQRSDDHGLTWSAPVPLVQPEPFPQGPRGDQYAEVAVGPGSVVHAIYWATGTQGQPSAIYHRASRDGGRTWDGPQLVAQAFLVFDLGVLHKYRSVDLPAIAVDQGTGDVYVAFPSVSAVDTDIYSIASFDEGRSWGHQREVNDDGLAMGQGLPTNFQWMPAIAVGPDHVVHLTWLDYRDDPAGQSAYVYYSHSQDRGDSWSKNQRLSDVPFDGTGGYHQSGSGTIGDYSGLAATRSGVHAIWADTRNQRNDLFSALVVGTVAGNATA
jgi:hypothetical protein